MRLRVLASTIFGVLLFMGSSQVRAQVDFVASAASQNQAFLSSQVSRNAFMQAFHGGSRGQVARPGQGRVGQVGQGIARRSLIGGSAFAQPTVAGAAVRLTYQPTPALSQQAKQEMLGRLRANNPQVVAPVEQEFRQHDFQRVYRGLVSPFGLRDNDTADILTAYTTLGYLIATGSADPSPQAVRALRAQIAPRLATNPQVSGPGTRAKLGEELKLLFVIMHAGWQSARKEGNLRQYSQGVAQFFQQQGGADLRQVRLTEQGFVRR